MIDIQITDISIVIAFWLAFTKMLAINFQLPIYDNLPIPGIVKILSTLLITYCFFPYIQNEILRDIAYVGVDHFTMLTIIYSIIGITIGYLVKSIMQIYISAGSIITQQIGFAAVRYFDPSSGQQVGPFEKLIQWSILIIIVSSGALIPMFKGVFSSFFTVHAYSLGKMASSHIFFMDLFKGIFSAALMLASPLIFTNMLINTILGIIARTVPQMNIIMVSFSVNIGLGLLVFFATSEEFFHVGFKIYTEKLGDWFQLLIL
ncbi:flagellar biosynthetic protein FliR [Halobacteriovorax sp. GB3]|uniref:flagellar biosynthetic protein FliR n=1 Tax=Halobacteriovorax sp. GB3 TaxID=2719615 RepID=UPI00235EB67A|nr:flagellar biosynthetic protein FliR [Halobacteriovorax sp. GB3]MDD0854113.1 flagellar biosynthetic protein FliR [Halobacteriovorax sp. GB3]